MGKNKFATAPFNFIPLPSKVLIRYRNKEELPGHDRFYVKEDDTQFYSGEISYSIKISKDSALMIGGGAPWREPLRENEVVEWKWKKGKTVFLFFEEERYIVILNKRNGYYLLVTAYYIETNHRLNLIKKQYKRAKK